MSVFVAVEALWLPVLKVVVGLPNIHWLLLWNASNLTFYFSFIYFSFGFIFLFLFLLGR